MNVYRIKSQDGSGYLLKAEGIHRDGDWIMLTNQAPVMESRRINHPASTEQPQGRIEDVMVSTGRLSQQPIAFFYKPISVELVPPTEEPSNGDDA